MDNQEGRAKTGESMREKEAVRKMQQGRKCSMDMERRHSYVIPTKGSRKMLKNSLILFEAPRDSFLK
jgi:hypothetical protein